MSRPTFSYTVHFIDDDGFMQHTLPPTYRKPRTEAQKVVRELRSRGRDIRIRALCRCGWESGNHVVWAAVDEQRKHHAARCQERAA